MWVACSRLSVKGNHRKSEQATSRISDERDLLFFPGPQSSVSRFSIVPTPRACNGLVLLCVWSCFFTDVVANFYTGVNIDLNDLMVVHSKRQSLHLHWTAERKIRQILQERLEKKNCT